jgi:hypothetical protein
MGAGLRRNELLNGEIRPEMGQEKGSGLFYSQVSQLIDFIAADLDWPDGEFKGQNYCASAVDTEILRQVVGSDPRSGRFARDSSLEGAGFEPVWGFSCQVVIFGL